MKWLANATIKDAKVILNVWPGLKIGKPVPVKLFAEELVGIYGKIDRYSDEVQAIKDCDYLTVVKGDHGRN